MQKVCEIFLKCWFKNISRTRWNCLIKKDLTLILECEISEWTGRSWGTDRSSCFPEMYKRGNVLLPVYSCDVTSCQGWGRTGGPEPITSQLRLQDDRWDRSFKSRSCSFSLRKRRLWSDLDLFEKRLSNSCFLLGFTTQINMFMWHFIRHRLISEKLQPAGLLLYQGNQFSDFFKEMFTDCCSGFKIKSGKWVNSHI